MFVCIYTCKNRDKIYLSKKPYEPRESKNVGLAENNTRIYIYEMFVCIYTCKNNNKILSK